jgi:hypothetical protein
LIFCNEIIGFSCQVIVEHHGCTIGSLIRQIHSSIYEGEVTNFLGVGCSYDFEVAMDGGTTKPVSLKPASNNLSHFR